MVRDPEGPDGPNCAAASLIGFVVTASKRASAATWPLRSSQSSARLPGAAAGATTSRSSLLAAHAEAHAGFEKGAPASGSWPRAAKPVPQSEEGKPCPGLNV